MAVVPQGSPYSSLPKPHFGKLGLGTMTFGSQTSDQSAFEILDAAIDSAEPVLIDTAEMYPIYPSAKTHGESERIIGRFIKSRKCREDVVVATKVASCNPQGVGATRLNWIRSGGETLKYDRKNIASAVHDSLLRLDLDYIDLVQLHWPERKVPLGDELDIDVSAQAYWTPFEEVLETLKSLVAAGLVRYIGISNETPWGLSKYLNLSCQAGGPGIAYAQHQYNLLNRTVDIGLAEIAVRERCPILAYAPLAGGRLTGKYLDDAKPDGSRYTKWPGPTGRYHNRRVDEAVTKYSEIAVRNKMSLVELAIGFVLSRPFCAAVIFGARTLSQYLEAKTASQSELSEDVLIEIEQVHRSFPNPAVIGAMEVANASVP